MYDGESYHIVQRRIDARNVFVFDVLILPLFLLVQSPLFPMITRQEYIYEQEHKEAMASNKHPLSIKS